MSDAKKLQSFSADSAITPAAPSPFLPSSVGAQNQSVEPKTIIIPVVSEWSADAVQGPITYPLREHVNGPVIIAKAHLLTTDSTTKHATYAQLTDAAPRTKVDEPHVVALEQTTDKKPVTYVIPPGHKVHNTTLFENPNAEEQLTVALSCHANQPSPDSLVAKVVRTPGLKTVQVYENLSPELYYMLKGDLKEFGNASSTTIGGENLIVVDGNQLDQYVAEYKKKYDMTMASKTHIGDHGVRIQTFAPSSHFGRSIANMAQSTKERNQLLEPNTRQLIVSRIEYTYYPVEQK